MSSQYSRIALVTVVAVGIGISGFSGVRAETIPFEHRTVDADGPDPPAGPRRAA